MKVKIEVREYKLCFIFKTLMINFMGRIKKFNDIDGN